MIDEIIRAYAELRRLYPGSGKPVAYSPDGPLVRFVRAVLKPIGDELKAVTDAAIGARYHTLKAELREPKRAD